MCGAGFLEPKGNREEPSGVCGIGGAMMDLMDWEVWRQALRLLTWSADAWGGAGQRGKLVIRGY